MNVEWLQALIGRLVLVSWQRWGLIASAVAAATGASTVTALATGRQTGVVLVIVVCLAIASVVRPDSHTAAVVVAIVVWQWLASIDDSTTAWSIALATLLFVFHSTVALMAVTPIGAVIEWSVLMRWSRRGAVVVGATVVMWALVVVMNERRAAGNVALTAVGLLVLTTLVLVMRAMIPPTDREDAA
jgi:hypothetical protein